MRDNSLKIGKFQIAEQIICKAISEENQDLLKQLKLLFSELIIIEAKYKPFERAVEFTAYSPKFQPIKCEKLLLEIPYYEIVFEETMDKQGNKQYKIIKVSGKQYEI